MEKRPRLQLSKLMHGWIWFPDIYLHTQNAVKMLCAVVDEMSCLCSAVQVMQSYGLV